MKEQLRTLLAKRGWTVSRRVELQLVRELIERLHAMTTEKSLIRIGAGGDGGYLVPDDLDGVAACFSPGVDVKITLEQVKSRF